MRTFPAAGDPPALRSQDLRGQVTRPAAHDAFNCAVGATALGSANIPPSSSSCRALVSISAIWLMGTAPITRSYRAAPWSDAQADARAASSAWSARCVDVDTVYRAREAASPGRTPAVSQVGHVFLTSAPPDVPACSSTLMHVRHPLPHVVVGLAAPTGSPAYHGRSVGRAG